MNFSVLQTSGVDGERWRALIEGLAPPRRDLHYWPEYASIYERSYGHQARLAYFGEGDQYVILPFVVRRLNGLDFLAALGIDEPMFDITNPYGYGGPLWRAKTDASALKLFADFDRCFREYCLDSGYASEFCSLHPLLRNHELVAASGLIEVREEKSVVYLDLTLSEAELWRQMSRGHKSSINKGRRNGVKVEQVVPNEGNLGVFRHLYLATMRRHHAAPKWTLPASYFSDCTAALGAERIALFFARINDDVAAAHLLIHDGFTAYYHFGGSDNAYATHRPSNCLLYECGLWAKRSGKFWYYLGGGVTSAADDQLLRFKTGFGPMKAPLYVYFRVHDERVYQKLCAFKREHEAMSAGRAHPDLYLPRYRQ